MEKPVNMILELVVTMGTEFLNIMDPEDVEKIISDLPFRAKIEKISLEKAHKRVVAEDVYATINLPPFSRASMDGYAVKSENTFKASEDKPISLKLLEAVGAGDVPVKRIENGTCTEVSTGAPIPEGADGVVMVESTEKTDVTTDEDVTNEILIYESIAMGQNIASEGSDVKKGELLLKKGTSLTPDKIGVLSAIGQVEVPVYAKPKVAVISTGNEVVVPGQDLDYGKIYDINSRTISDAVKTCGCMPIHSEIVKDDYNTLKNKINEFEDVDIIITSGGTSAGAGDVLRTVMDEIGEVLVHGIAVKPGKPTLICLIPGKTKKKILFGLPGYPVAALMVFYIFVAPFLRKAACLKVDSNVPKFNLKLSRRYRPARGRSHNVLVKIEGDTAVPILKDSGAIASLAQADGFIKVPKNIEILEKGSMVEVLPFETS
ncbi:molybdopterin-binding protein [Methanobacterium congolense]|uniref:molybdopterin molybdotransferase n=1 Tax=Methanobacterium congolense TaxID=118062 RepID=A0A1D3L018_9EURY|nr:Gephyrin [Methanobacterium congolense]